MMDLNLNVYERAAQQLLPSENIADHERAWQTYWHTVEQAVLKYIRCKNRTRTEDAEILADAMAIAYMEVERGHYQVRTGVPFTAYVKGIARNLILEAYRRDRRFVPLLVDFDHPSDDDFETDFQRAQERELLYRHLNELSPRRRQVLLLYCEGYTTEQIALKLDIREDLVRQEKTRGIQQLRRRLEAEVA